MSERPEGENIAIVGLSCRFPGADTPEAFWKNVAEKKHALGPPPEGRWAADAARFTGGFLAEVRRFDAERFRIDPGEAAVMDPQQRLALTVAAETIARAGDLGTPRVGVFVGAGQLAYQELVLQHLEEVLPPGTLAGNLLSMIAARIAHAFDFKGPALTVDTACSGALVALHLACSSLRAGECEMALAGGVNLNLAPTVFRMFERAGALSRSGRCLPFSKDADGTVPADGVGLFLLEPLARAQKMKRTIHGVILGSAVNNCGRTIGVMAPGAQGQRAVMRAALENAGIAASEVSFVEAHATGTLVGDGVERASIARVYPHGPRIGAVKQFIGHALGAAGAASLLRALGELGPDEVGAVNAFGFGGTNAHLVVRGPRERVVHSAGAALAGPAGPAPEHWLSRFERSPRRADGSAEGWVHVVRAEPDGRSTFAPCPRGEPVLESRGRHLITGATGGIGRVLALHLAARYGARLVLVARGEDAGGALVRAVEAAGGEAHFVRGDVTDPASVRRIIEEARARLGEIDGYFAAAGVAFEGAMRTKREGLLAFEDLERRFTVLFSSISAVIPGLDRGLEEYARANAWLDATARERAMSGERIASIAWPPWQDVGMAASVADVYRARGISPIDPVRAMECLEWALSSGEPNVVVLDRGDAERAGPGKPREELEAPLRALIADAAELRAENVRLDAHFTELGIDSVGALELVKKVEALAGRTLPPTFLFENDTLQSLLQALARDGAQEHGAPARVAATIERERERERERESESEGGREAGERAWPLLPSQQTFLAQRKFFPDLPGNTLIACTVTREDALAPLQPELLQRALELIVDRHVALRSVVRREGGRWLQCEGGERPRVFFASTVDEQAILNRGFDLERGPLLEAHTDGTRLLLNAHHLAVDAWSAKIILEELLTAYEALRAGTRFDLPPPRATWPEASRALAEHDRDGASIDHWRERFATGVPPLPLPWTGDPASPRGPGRAHVIALDAEATQSLEALARAEALSLPSLVLAIYLERLWAWSGQHDLIVRVAFGRRELRVPDVTRIVGSFADSLPIRVEVIPREATARLARRVQSELALAQAHASSSSVALASLEDRTRGLPSGLTPAGFSFLKLPAPSRVGALSVSRLEGASVSGFTGIGLIAWLFDGRLHLSFNHLPALLSREVVDRFAEGLVASLLRTAGGAESSAYEATAAVTLPERVLESCRRNSDRIAIEARTYADLDRASAVVAESISETIGGARVAVLAPPGADAVAAVLGVMRAGAAYVPLDPDWPDARIAQVLSVAEPAALIATAETTARARGLCGRPVHTVRFDVEPAAREVRRGEHAYVMFTSGSSGTPKGVVVAHRAVLRFLDWVQAMLGVGADDRFLMTSSLGFGGSIRQMYSPLLAGAMIVPASPETKRDPGALLSLLEQARISIFNSVPSLWAYLMDALERRGARAALPELRWILIGGEVVPAALVRRWRRLVGQAREARFGVAPASLIELPKAAPLSLAQPHHRLANLYGSTETIVNATWHEIVADPDPGDSLTPIGWPRSGSAVELVDENGGVGELLVGGEIADGYLGDPERTREAFVDHPRIGRAYRTGDLARRLPGGALVYLGRIDSQVQIHGNRVELGELEAVLANHASVRSAIATYDGDRLRASVEPHAGSAVSAEELRDFVRSRLPAYMVPHHVELVSRLPKTAAGKADRRSIASTQPPAFAPELARIWTELLELRAPPRLEDDFFRLGGDSILILEVIERMRARTRALPSPRMLYAARTLAGHAKAFEDAAAATNDVTNDSTASDAPFPLTPVQRGFWLAEKLRGRQPIWRACVPVEGAIDVEHLRRALSWLVLRHPMLRTVLLEHEGRPMQQTLAELPIELAFDDLSSLPGDAILRALQQRFEEEARADFDLARGPLFRVRLLRTAADRHQLIISAHHIISDAHSAYLAASELLQAHAAFARGEEPALAPPEGLFQGEALRAEPPRDPWWSHALEGVGIERPAPGPRDVEAELSLDEASFARLSALARRRGLSPFVLVLGRIFEALQEVLGADEVVVATAWSGREGDALRLAKLIGPFASALPIRVRGRADGPAVARAFEESLKHAPGALATIPEVLGSERASRLGRFFFSWLDPASAAAPSPSSHSIHWSEGQYAFSTESTDTEVNIGAVVDRGLFLHLRGGPLVERVRTALLARLREAPARRAALIVYPPDGVPLPIRAPIAIETVEARDGVSELILLPIAASELARTPELFARVEEALAATDAEVIALAGMLPALTGLGRRPFARRGSVVTTGHAATVAAMVKTIERALSALQLDWRALVVGVLGFGSIGRAVLELANACFGAPRRVIISDPLLSGREDSVLGADLILGASSGGASLDVEALRPGTVVIDDSFPRAFDDRAAWARMRAREDVLLAGGGTLDVGPLIRSSPFLEADAVRALYPTRWLPGCHAEALLLLARPELGPTIGPVDAARAKQVLALAGELGWSAPPLHLGAEEVPEAIIAAVRALHRGRR